LSVCFIYFIFFKVITFAIHASIFRYVFPVFAIILAYPVIRSSEKVEEHVRTMFAEETTAWMCVAGVVFALIYPRPLWVVASKCHIAYVISCLDLYFRFHPCCKYDIGISYIVFILSARSKSFSIREAFCSS